MLRQQTPTGRAAVILALLMIWPFGGGQKVLLTATHAVPGASGYAVVAHDRNDNTTVELRVRFLPPPDALTPAASVYVVWAQPSGRPPHNYGELRIGSNHEGSALLRSPYRDFELFVTAEESARATQPSGARVIFGRITRPR